MNASDFAQEHRADDDKSYPNSIPVERTKRLEKTIFMFEKKTILCLKKKRDSTGNVFQPFFITAKTLYQNEKMILR